jgi:AcrR family transcriptional regulator
MAAAPDRPDSEVRKLPRGRHGLPRSVVVENQRERIFASLAAVCAEKGYASVTVKDITDHAGVSRRTFYDLFTDKEECFLAAYDVLLGRVWDRVNAAYSQGRREWPERITAALAALIKLYVAEPDFARLLTVDVMSAGEVALARRDAALTQFAVFFEGGAASLPPAMAGRDLLVQAVIGGLSEILYAHIVERQVDRLPEIMPDLLYCVLVPYLGHPTAMRAMDAAKLAPPVKPRVPHAPDPGRPKTTR